MSNYADLTRDRLAALVPELMLAGQLIDRSGMAWCIGAWGREAMAQVAIDEWSAASPIYTRRVQRALGFEGDDVITIFKGLQFDIGAPSQFLDMVFTLESPLSGRFRLAHCGALCDVEPMGEAYVRSMCHDIEDPTFDATAIATNARAQVRPVHRPPGGYAPGQPVCEWTVVIDPAHPEARPHPALTDIAATRAAQVVLADIDADDAGLSAYDGPLLDNVDLAAFSHSALVRIADEVALQSHLLNLAFVNAITRRGDDGTIAEKQVVGWAGAVAARLHRWLGADSTVERVRALHPLFNPAAYVDTGLAAHDPGWLQLDLARARAAIAAAVEGGSESDEVGITKLSSGFNFEFEPRRSMPLTVL